MLEAGYRAFIAAASLAVQPVKVYQALLPPCAVYSFMLARAEGFVGHGTGDLVVLQFRVYGVNRKGGLAQIGQAVPVGVCY